MVLNGRGAYKLRNNSRKLISFHTIDDIGRNGKGKNALFGGFIGIICANSPPPITNGIIATVRWCVTGYSLN